MIGTHFTILFNFLLKRWILSFNLNIVICFPWSSMLILLIFKKMFAKCWSLNNHNLPPIFFARNTFLKIHLKNIYLILLFKVTKCYQFILGEIGILFSLQVTAGTIQHHCPVCAITFTHFCLCPICSVKEVKMASNTKVLLWK